MPASLSRCFNTILAYAPYPIGVMWARWLAGNALTQRLFFARDIKSINEVYEDACGIRLDDRAVQRLLMAKAMRSWLQSKIPKFSDRELARHIRINGLDMIQAFSGSGRSVLLASAHYVDAGCVTTVLARLGIDFRGVRRSRPKRCPSYGRSRYIYVGGDSAVPGYQEISHVLKGGGLIHSVFDGLQGTDTVARPFLGRVCHFRRALAELAWTEGAAIVPVSIRSDLDGSILLEFHEPISLETKDMPMNTAVATIIERYAAFLETTIRTYPWCFDPTRLELFWRRTSVDEADGPRPAAAS